MGNYVVKQGDTIWGIARSLGIPTADLVKWNDLGANPNDIKVGQTLKLSAVTAPAAAPLPTGSVYDTKSYDSTKKGQTALGAYNTAKDAVSNYGDFTYGNQAQLDSLIKSILNREKFSYDLNGDALYQQYKDKFVKQGKMAMGDAIGQASAMTGGYGNSYAQSVGQQAYQAQLENLNDIVPELYQMAYDKYNQEGQDLYNQYGLLSEDYDREYGTWNDKYGRLMDKLGIARSDYYDGADMFYTEQNNKNSVEHQKFEDAMAIWNANNTNAWNTAEWDYRNERDKIEDEQWLKAFEEQKKSETPVNDPVDPNSKAISNFKSKLVPESAHDAIARKMYGPYAAYVAVQLAQDSSLTDEEKKYLITYYGITDTDLQYARDKGYDL